MSSDILVGVKILIASVGQPRYVTLLCSTDISEVTMTGIIRHPR